MKQRIPLLAALAALTLHVLANAHYGFFRDELYFIICGRHPAWGYVDQPPLVPWVAAATQAFGHSLFALRLVPAVAAAALTGTSVLFARRLGGGVFAQVLTGLCVTLAPGIMLEGVLLSTDVFQLTAWTVAVLCVQRIITRGDDPRTGLVLGAALGIAALSKYSVAFFGFAAIAGLLLTPQRRVLRSRAVAIGIGLAVVLASPSVIWQSVHGWPFLELLRNGANGKNVVLGPVAFPLAQIQLLDPLYAPVWLAGLWMALRRAQLRWLGLTYVVLYLVLFALHAKAYYLVAIYPVFFAAGAVQIAAWTESRAPWRPAILGAVGLAGLLLMPLALPVLPIDSFIAYEEALHLAPPATGENTKLVKLPQYWADMFGWPEMAAAVATAYAKLSPEERERAYILADNYGEASAVTFFGARLGVPPAISGHNAYYTWGYGNRPAADIMLDMGATVADDRRFCVKPSLGATFTNAYAMPYENGLGIVVCRGMHKPLREVFPKQRHFN